MRILGPTFNLFTFNLGSRRNDLTGSAIALGAQRLERSEFNLND